MGFKWECRCYYCTRIDAKGRDHRYPVETSAQNFADNFCAGCQSAPCKDNAYGCSDDPDCLHPETEQCSWCAEWKPILASMSATKEAGR